MAHSYIKDILFDNIKNSDNDFDFLATSMRSLADKYNVKLKSLNRDIRWALEKNIFDLDIFLRQDDYYIATKNILLWLCDFFKFYWFDNVYNISVLYILWKKEKL